MQIRDVNIDGVGMIMAYLAILPGLAVLWIYRVKLTWRSCSSVIRMSVQLLLAGLYLKYIFAYNSVWINLGWVLVMIVAANFSTLRQTDLNWRLFAFPAIFALLLGALPLLVFFVVAVTQQTMQDASLVVPIAGMLLGNALKGNVTAVDRFYREVWSEQETYLCRLMLGASGKEALMPYMRDAVHGSITPFLASMATIGIVSLPGMMTGQLLGGATPMVAIRYQIAIMVSIYSVMLLTSALFLVFTRRFAFMPNKRMKENVFLTKPITK